MRKLHHKYLCATLLMTVFLIYNCVLGIKTVSSGGYSLSKRIYQFMNVHRIVAFISLEKTSILKGTNTQHSEHMGQKFSN